ncbi:MAG TPA: alpha/beta hydrolase [Puia sp.]|nr:alpha/beta hydrolase [Puia sp.]
MDKIINYESSPVFYRIEGEGFPVVLIHGFAEDGTIWQNQIAYLAKSYKLIIPDLPGSGNSSFNSKLLSIADFADCIKFVLDEEKISTCIIIGHSLGGYITLAFAEKYREKLKAFGLFHSTAYADSEEKKTARKKAIVFIKKYGSGDFIKQSVPNLFAEDFNKKHPEIVNELIERYNNFNPDSLVSYYDAMMKRPDRTQVLKSFKKPVLFIAGEKDNAVPIEHSLQQSYLPELCYFHILMGAAHMGMFETVNLSNEIVNDFLKRTIQ